MSAAESVCVNDMVEAIVKSGSPVKSQQIGEAELSPKERREELLQQYRSRPLVFLERYHVCAHSSYTGWEHRCINTYNQTEQYMHSSNLDTGIFSSIKVSF